MKSIDYRARTKEALAQLGVLAGAVVRPQRRPLDARQRSAIRAGLRRAELL
jgi:hypothetical protein